MDTKIEIKEEDPLIGNVASRNEMDFFTKVVTVKTNSDAVLLDNYCDITIKREIKSETIFPKFCSQKERRCFSKYLIKSDTVPSSKSSERETKLETEEQTRVLGFVSQSNKEFLPEDPAIKIMKCNSNHEMNSKIEIKEEPLWLETGTSFVCDDIKHEDFVPLKFSRLCSKAFSGDSGGKSTLSSAKGSQRDTSSLNGKDHPEYVSKETDVTEIITEKQLNLSEEFAKHSNVGELFNRILHMKQKDVMYKCETPHKCTICDISFTEMTVLKRHNLIHKHNKSYQCKTCDTSFTRLAHLQTHNLIHEGKKPHQCKTCNESFTHLSNLKRHNLIHEDKRPHQCKTCAKCFTRLSHLLTHNLIHEGKKPYQCKICDRNFAQLAHLKSHNLTHEGNKPHQCKTCGKSFTHSSNLKRHTLIHEGKKPHQCKTCDKRFARLSDLQMHTLIHEGKKPHQCEICGKSFIQLSNLKTHNLIHEDKKPHQCKICDKCFTKFSSLKRHNLIHQSIKII